MFQTPFAMQSQYPQNYMMYPTYKDSTLYIGDLDETITNDLLFNYFARFGTITNARVMKDSTNHKSRGFGFVSYSNPQDSERARIAANHEVIIRKPIRVCPKKSMKEIEKEANVFLKEVDQSISIKDIDSTFSLYGKIFSSKISTDDDGIPVGYGYVQFESKAEAEECLAKAENGKIKVGDKEVTVERFVPYSARDTNSLKRNLYIKNLPSTVSEAELTEMIKTKFSTYGVITSAMVKVDPNIQKPFAFVCFETFEAAGKALEEMSALEGNIFGGDEKLYIGWALSTASRKKQLRGSNPTFSMSETNLFLKNLKETTTEEQLRTVFSQFGEIDSLRLKAPEKPQAPIEGQRKFPNTQFAFVSYKDKEVAKNVIYQAPRTQEVQELFETIFGSQPSVYISFHMNAASYKLIKENKKRTINYSMILRGMPFIEPYMMGMQQPFHGQGQPMQPYQGQPQMYQQQMPVQYGGQQPQYGGGYPNQYRGSYNRPRGGPGGQHRRPQNYGGQQGRNGRPQYSNPNHQNVRSAPKPEPTVPEKMTIQTLKADVAAFLALPIDKQRVILGELLFPLVSKFVTSNEMAPKVTGMLIDLEVFEVKEILEFIETEEILLERVNEAVELLNQEVEE